MDSITHVATSAEEALECVFYWCSTSCVSLQETPRFYTMQMTFKHYAAAEAVCLRRVADGLSKWACAEEDVLSLAGGAAVALKPLHHNIMTDASTGILSAIFVMAQIKAGMPCLLRLCLA